MRPSHTALVAALLAFMAVFSLSALSGWHASVFHDDLDVAQSLSHTHSHGETETDLDKLVHVAAHCLGHAVDVPADRTIVPSQPAETRLWPGQLAMAMTEHEPASLLRPPQG